MTKAVNKLSDKLLSLFVRETTAGACVPEHGEYCFCRGGRKYRHNCTGICTKTTTAC